MYLERGHPNEAWLAVATVGFLWLDTVRDDFCL